ncbi:unnamed protein product [Cyclocybe aegerita]|uniref:Uncharacterized protein n=1 Tax=Cyclocybe aegerita TaxID=1973307 RepID=A0A8S0XLZ3_CYCAE|nr:unnamed protein product [Cyclocybe aegerita]
MKTSTILVAISLAMSAAAAAQNNGKIFGNNRGFLGQSSGGFGGKNGQKNNNAGTNTGKNANAGNTNTNANANNNSKNTPKAVGAIGAGAAAGAAGGAAAGVATGNGNNNTAASATAGSANTGDLQTSLTLDPKVIASGFANNGQDVPEAGQVASLTSTNNFINFCLTVPNLPITNGKQITTGSCNPAPMGAIPSNDNMPSAKFQIPKNGDTLKANTDFTITMAIQGMQTGAFVNAQENYFAAPQQLNAQGQIIGHSHVVVEQLSALDQTTPTDPKNFIFFKGLNAAASNGVLTAEVTGGLPAGVYKVSSINTAANHQPVLVPVAQHGSLDDVAYFTVTVDGQAAAGANAGAAGPPAAGVGAAGQGAATGAVAGTATYAATGAAAGAAGKGGAKTGAAGGVQAGTAGKKQAGRQQGKRFHRRVHRLTSTVV